MAKNVKVKICGITNWPDAKRACEAGADFLGFNFYRESPRYIAPSKARGIVARLPRHVASVGVFVNASEDDIRRIARQVGLKCVQLHGDETPDFVAQLSRSRPAIKVIKAIRIRKTFRAREVTRFKNASAILLDGFDRRRPGGTGRTFNWLLARRTNAHRIFVAGGLKPENVAEAIRIAQPYAIDVCSGVESSPGKKDPAKIVGLMRAVNGFRYVNGGK
jgi:phosphoribosylanthranilate isomerase